MINDKGDQGYRQNPNLISGFFSAILSFAERVVGGDNEVNKISLENSNFYFIKKETNHYILETDLVNPNYIDEDFFELLTNLATMIKKYILKSGMDDSFMQITDAKISKKISSLISQYIPSSFEKKILEMFQEQDNISDFSHILELEGNGFSKRGIISAKRVKYHRFVRSRLYKEWLKKFIRSKEDFSFMYFGDAFVLTTNLYGMLILTLGIHISSFNIDHRFDGMKGMIDFLKGKAVSLGEKILS